MNVAEEFPALVSDYTTALRPTVPDGWIPALRTGLQQIMVLQRGSGMSCWISDIKEKYGQLSIQYQCDDPQIESVISGMETEIPHYLEGGNEQSKQLSQRKR